MRRRSLVLGLWCKDDVGGDGASKGIQVDSTPVCVILTPALEGRLGVEGNEAWFAESGIFTVAMFGKDAEGGNGIKKPEKR